MPAATDNQNTDTMAAQQPNTSSSFGDFGEPTTTSAPQKTIKTTGTKENGNVSKKKVVLATVSTLFVVGAVVVGVSLVQQQQLKVGLAWDCSKYNFEVSREGSVSVINSSSRSEPLQEAMVKINGSLVATFDVPALSQGQSSSLGQVSVSSSGGFSWQVIGSVDCQDTGNYDPLISPTPTTEPTATQTPTITPTITPGLTVTPTTPPGITAQCLSPKAYDTEWNLLSQSDLSTLKTGDAVRFAVSGTATSGFFDKAQFTINGALRPEVTDKKPGTQEFFDEYVIPEGTTSFKINAQVHHSDLGWF